MGLASGGKMTQEIYDVPFAFVDLELQHRSRCFVHLADSMQGHQITGAEPPSNPLNAKAYSDY